MSKLGVTPWDIVRVQPFDPGGFIDSNPLVSSEASIQKFINADGDLQSARLLFDSESQKSTLHEYLPSLYTGSMRKLMQVSHLRGESLFYGAKHDQLKPNWSDTHGIWISSPVDGFCNRYVIRINSSGVYRIPITFSQPLPANWRTLEAASFSLTPEEAAQQVGRLWSAGNFDSSLAVKIADTPLMYTDNNGGIYGTCGWAFDSDGQHAANVGVRIDPDDPAEARRQASLYVITITEGAGGIPVSASCAMQERGELVNQFDDTDQEKGPAIIQVADVIAGERGFCRSFSCYPGTIGPRLFSTNTPVFAYYDSSDALHVVRFTPIWNISTSNTSTTMEQARGSPEIFPDIFDGDNSQSASVYGADSAWPYTATGYPSSVMGASWGSDSNTTGRTMRFTSPLVPPVGTTLSASKMDSNFQTYNSLTAGGTYSLVFMTIDWDVTQINLNTGEINTFPQCRLASSDNSAVSRLTAQGVVTKSRSYNQVKNNHQVLILHGFDRTSYAIYSREQTIETGVTVSYGGSNMAVPDASSFQYNGIHSGGAWVDHSINSYHSDTTTDNIRTIKNCVGVSRIPSGMLIYQPSGDSSVTPPVGFDEPDSNVSIYTGKAVVGDTAYDVAFESNAVEQVFIDHNFFYKAGGSIYSRAFYQDRENLTGANVVGVGSYTAATNRLTCFVGWF